MNALKQVLFHGQDPQSLRSLTIEISSGILNHQGPIQHLLTCEKPALVCGRDLFNAQYSNHFNADVLRRWNTLSTSIQRLFDDEEYIEKAYQSSLRIWQQYEIVRFLQRFLNMTYDPYQYLDLTPQEIVMDKILQGPGDGDIYDNWVHKALTTRSTDPISYTQRFLRLFKPKFPTNFHQFLRDNHQTWNTEGIGAIVREGKARWPIEETHRHGHSSNRVYSSVASEFWRQWLVLHYMELQGHQFKTPWRTSDFSSVYYNNHQLKYYMFVSHNKLQAIPFEAIL